jgi:hypothetical protein
LHAPTSRVNVHYFARARHECPQELLRLKGKAQSAYWFNRVACSQGFSRDTNRQQTVGSPVSAQLFNLVSFAINIRDSSFESTVAQWKNVWIAKNHNPGSVHFLDDFGSGRKWVYFDAELAEILQAILSLQHAGSTQSTWTHLWTQSHRLFQLTSFHVPVPQTAAPDLLRRWTKR